MKLKIYGCRGSVAMCHGLSRYGGNTSCFSLSCGDDFIVIDAGSGIMALRNEILHDDGLLVKYPINILLGHLHLDHLVGLGTFDPVWKKNQGARVFTISRDDRPMLEQISGVFAPPYWPVSPAPLGTIEVYEIHSEQKFAIGGFEITPFEADVHPNQTTAFHISHGDTHFVYLLDSEIVNPDAKTAEMLDKYCAGADMIIFDAAYTDEDYAHRAGFGHSTVSAGVKLAAKWNCKKMVFSHFDQKYLDEELDSWLDGLDNQKFIMARDGLVIEF